MHPIQIIKEKPYSFNYSYIQEKGRDVLNSYYSLNQDEAVQLANYAMRQDKNTRWAILQNLALLVPGSISHLYKKILNLKIEESETFFINAPDDICDYVIQQLESDIAANRETYMACILAWIGTPKAVEKINELRKTEITISSYWQTKIENIPIIAGWELTPKGQRRNLYLEESCILEEPEQGKIEFLDEYCPLCGQQLYIPFSFDLSNENLSFLNCKGKLLKILTCINCDQYGPVFSIPDFTNNSLWHKKNTKSEYMIPSEESIHDDWAFSKAFTIGERGGSPYEWIAWLPNSPYHIGGFPSWVQFPEYPSCPDCQQTMKFLAQINNGMEIYAFICPECNTTATLTQAD